MSKWLCSTATMKRIYDMPVFKVTFQSKATTTGKQKVKMKTRFLILAVTMVTLSIGSVSYGQQALNANMLKRMLNVFPDADTNEDGKLTRAEASAFRKANPQKVARELAKLLGNRGGNQGGVKRTFKVDPGWDKPRFPEAAVSYRSPKEIREIYAEQTSGKEPAVVAFEKPTDGALRVVGVGHSFMVPGYKALPKISKAAGMQQPLYTHVGGGMTGSARYKWEQENGIFQFAGKPVPKLLASIANAPWDAMMFGPYYNDRAVYYSSWFDFCLKYNPDMKFYLSDAWPQLEQLPKQPKSEAFFTDAVLDQMAKEKRETYAETLQPLLKSYPGKVFVLPTSDAMVLAAKHFLRGELPGIEGLHRAVGGKERSLWSDRLGHLGPGFNRLEGYVFYATLYGKSPEEIKGPIDFGGNGDFPSPELDRMFRKIAWQAVLENPYSGVSKD